MITSLVVAILLIFAVVAALVARRNRLSLADVQKAEFYARIRDLDAMQEEQQRS